MGRTAPDQLSLELEPRLPRLPGDLRQMLARPAAVPFDDPAWSFEPWWDGLRALAHVEDGRLRLRDARGRELADRFPELLGLVDVVSGAPLVLDGEIVIPDGTGRGDPGALQRRLRPEGGVRRARSRVGAATYLVNDLLVREGRTLLSAPLARRRRVLVETLRASDRVLVVPAIAAEGRTLYEASAAQGLPGVLARRADSPYLPGVRSDLWRQIRSRNRFDAVVGGYRAHPDGRLDILLGAWERTADGADRLVAIGAVEAIAETSLIDLLLRSFRRLATQVSPFERGARAEHRWVRPELVVTTEHQGWTNGRLVRPRLVAVRDDLEARACRLPPAPRPEQAEGPAARPVLALLQRLPLGD